MIVNEAQLKRKQYLRQYYLDNKDKLKMLARVRYYSQNILQDTDLLPRMSRNGNKQSRKKQPKFFIKHQICSLNFD